MSLKAATMMNMEYCDFTAVIRTICQKIHRDFADFYRDFCTALQIIGL